MGSRGKVGERVRVVEWEVKLNEEWRAREDWRMVAGNGMGLVEKENRNGRAGGGEWVGKGRRTGG